VDTAVGYLGYTVQFNKHTSPRYSQVCQDPPTCSSFTNTQIGTVVLWEIQVSVTPINTSPDELQKYQSYLAANCTGTLSGFPTETPLCSSGPTGTALVFQRFPSEVITNAGFGSTFWPSMPLLKQFKQMYSTDPMSDLTSQDHSTEYQYFYCSG
jgi:hypothetical protein